MNRPPSLWVEREQDAERGAFSSERWRAQTERARERSQAPRDPEPQPPPPPRRRAWALPAAALAAALVALALAGLALLGGEDAADPSAALLTDGRPLPRSAVGRVYEAAGPGVVSVQAGQSSGTGWVASADGTIVTNAHVVGEQESALVRFGDSGRQVQAEVLGSDPSSDLAVLRVDPGGAGRLAPLTLADSAKVQVGDPVVAIGHPFKLDRTATAGIVSGLGREIRAPDGFQIDDVIQTDAPINPGNSGGPLLDARGRVIGVNSQIASQSGGNVGIGFAVSSNTVREVLPKLRRGERIERGFMGVSTTPDPAGARVEEVTPGSPADGEDVRVGDVIAGVEGRPVRSPEDLVDAIGDRKPGERVEVEVLRDGERRTVELELGVRPRTP